MKLQKEQEKEMGYSTVAEWEEESVSKILLNIYFLFLLILQFQLVHYGPEVDKMSQS